MKKLAEKLRVLRAQSGIKNKEIAEKIGKSMQSVSNYMSTENPITPDIETLKKLAEVFNVDISYLLSENESKREPPPQLAKEIHPTALEIHKKLMEMPEAERERWIKVINFIVEQIKGGANK
jgi:transcriptional regulator with XRE-family HTH domain